jgi:phospholipid/cholesterol/gamma-HCH transport system permease protein
MTVAETPTTEERLAGAPAAAQTHAPPTFGWFSVPGGPRVQLAGHWNLRSTRFRACELLDELTRLRQDDTDWDLTQLDDLDPAGAVLLWRAWGEQRPARLALRPEDERLFERLEALAACPSAPPRPSTPVRLMRGLARTSRVMWHDTLGVISLLGSVTLNGLSLLRRPAEAPWREISATIYRSGLRSLLIISLVGFLIGIVLSYLVGEQLHDFGADGYIVNLMGITSLRELGPVIAAIINAGRSGSSMTAQIGLMRVTSELDALSVLGISRTVRLVLPRVVGQIITLPLLVLWTDGMAVLGGMLGAKFQLGVAPRTFLHSLPEVVPMSNLWFGLGKGAVFGALIALVACYFGLTIRPDTEGLATGTTESVVSALTLVLLADAVFAIMFAHIGL